MRNKNFNELLIYPGLYILSWAGCLFALYTNNAEHPVWWFMVTLLVGLFILRMRIKTNFESFEKRLYSIKDYLRYLVFFWPLIILSDLVSDLVDLGVTTLIFTFTFYPLITTFVHTAEKCGDFLEKVYEWYKLRVEFRKSMRIPVDH